MTDDSHDDMLADADMAMTSTMKSPFDEKVDSIATVLDEFPPMQVLKAVEQLADDPESKMDASTLATSAANVASISDFERELTLMEKTRGNGVHAIVNEWRDEKLEYYNSPAAAKDLLSELEELVDED